MEDAKEFITFVSEHRIQVLSGGVQFVVTK